MIDRVITFSVRRRWLVVAAAVLLAAWGGVAAVRAPVDAIPDLSENQQLVYAEWPGHGPREIEDQVTYPLALELKGLAGVKTIRSSSDVGFCSINVIFDEGVGWGAAHRSVADALAGAAGRWPAGVAPRLGPDAPATGQIFWYTVEGGGLDPGRLRAVQDWFVRPQLAAVPGVAEVATVGGRPLEYQVELDPHRLRVAGVDPAAVTAAVGRANAAAGGGVVLTGNAEAVVRGAGWLGARPGDPDAPSDPQRVVRDLEAVTVPGAGGTAVPVGDLGRVTLGGGPRRGVLDKDGSDAVGGVVMMRHGENPREVTRRLREKLRELQPGLPPGVRVVAVYDRTPLIRDTIGTVTGTLLEAILTATVCVVVVLRHLRTAFVVALTLPLAVLFSFGCADLLRRLGVVEVETNLMSLAGLAVSVGVLVDASIVMAENAMHKLRLARGPHVTGDTRPEVLAACREVGRPIVFSVLIILLSFLPVFALGGLEGTMFRPFAYTKSFAMLGVGLLSITLVPALCTVFVRGRLRSEEEVPLVRGLTRVYRPVLAYLLDRPLPIVWLVGLTLVLGAVAVGPWLLVKWVLTAAVVACLVVGVAHRPSTQMAAGLSLAAIGLAAAFWVPPLDRRFLTPLDEGMVMDMPITVPRMSVTQAADDLRARDMVLCRFPEVEMVVGKAGRAETAADPAPLDMIETMIGFRRKEYWPRRCLRPADAEAQAAAVLDGLIARGLVRDPGDRTEAANRSAMAAVPLFDAQMREAAYQRNEEFGRDLGHRLAVFAAAELVRLLDRPDTPVAPAVLAGHAAHFGMDPTPEAVSALVRDVLRAIGPDAGTPKAGWWDWLVGPTPLDDRLYEIVRNKHRAEWREYTTRLNADLLDRGAGVYTRLVLEQLLHQADVIDPRVAAAMHEWHTARTAPPTASPAGEHHHGGSLPFLTPVPELDSLQTELTARFARGLLLWPRDRAELAGFGGELDRAMQMPGWANVWTMPIQNRVDMLSTGVNTAVGVRVLGRRLDDVVKASEEIAAVLKGVPGAADVIADPVRGKAYLEVVPDRAKCARHGVDPGAVTELVGLALGGRVATTTVEGRERHPVRVRFARDSRTDAEAVGDLPVPARGGWVPLSSVADVRLAEGPASIKGENGLARNYVRLNVRGRDDGEFVEVARQAVASQVRLPEGVTVEWTGQFEHAARARRTLFVAVPAVVGLIFLLLWWTYRDLADAVLMLLAVPGALAGGLVLQRLLGEPLGVAAWVGLIACFGMATSTGVIMLVYLRQAVAAAEAAGPLTPERLRAAVLDGAAQRLRPKLLTEATTLLGLAPLLLATGTGSEVLRPMVVPVLGGLLVADEVIDLFLPVLFYRVRRWRLGAATRGS